MRFEKFRLISDGRKESGARNFSKAVSVTNLKFMGQSASSIRNSGIWSKNKAAGLLKP
jgi:hypothetical protein